AARLLAHAHAGAAGHARHRAAAHALAHRPHHLLGLLERSSSWLICWTVVPEPLAMRLRREPLMILGSLRSCGVIERMIASILPISPSSKLSSASRYWPMFGSMPSIFLMLTMFLSCCI